MIIKKFQIISIIFILFIQINSVSAVSVSDSMNISQQVLNCNFNGICEPALGESSVNCPLDCPPAPPPPAPGGGGGGSRDTIPPVIYNLFIGKITLNSVEISWRTNEIALCKIFWGKTSEYESGSITEADFFLEHSTELTGFSPQTNYHFKVSCHDPQQNESETTDQKFSTLTPADLTPPANISDFEAIPGDTQIILKWKNPPDVDFKGVKIMRSENFYPQNPWEGALVYNDRGTSFTDTDLKNDVTYYYTAFAYDKAGNYSSGAIASATPFKGAIPPPISPPPVVSPPPEIEKIKLEDFDFIQEGKKIALEELEIKTDVEKPLTISLDYEKVPEVLKTIMITLEKQGKFFSFLLRVNIEKTAYFATLMPPEETGDYPLTITILDYKNQTLKKIDGQLKVKRIEVPSILWYQKYRIHIYILFGILILLGIGYFIWNKLKVIGKNKKEIKRNL
jgi:chitodextrinase